MRQLPACAGTVFITLLTSHVVGSAAAASPAKKVVLIAGTKSHGPGHHEYEKGVRLLAHCLNTSPDVDGIRTEVHLDGWPKNPATLDDADTILMFCDGSDRDEQAHPLLRGDRLATIEKQMQRGCGFIAIHYTVFVPAQKAGPRFLDWIGGYFDYENGPEAGGRRWYSKIKTATTTASPAASDHPICRGLPAFRLREEYYYNIRFRENDDRRVPVLTTVIPGESEPQTVAWAVQRADGGRGFGFTGGHFHDNWQVDNFRRMVLNAIVWTAHADVPAGGVQSSLPASETGLAVNTLIVTGHNHPAHDWQATTVALNEAFAADARFQVTTVTDPEFMATSDLSRFDVLVLNYCNDKRPGLSEAARTKLMRFVTGCGGMTIVHFANGAFRDWPDYRRLCRRVWVDDVSGHDPYGPFRVDITRPDHPIMRGMKPFDTTDELYFRQGGDLPVEVIATARSKVTGEDAPMAFVYTEGKGRIFQTVLGHDAPAIRSNGTAELIRRGTMWAAGTIMPQR